MESRLDVSPAGTETPDAWRSEACRRALNVQRSLARTLEELGQSVAVWSPETRIVQRTASLEKLLAHQADGERLWAECQRVVSDLGSRCLDAEPRAHLQPASHRVAIGKSRFGVTGSIYSLPGVDVRPLVVVSVARVTSALPSESELVERFALTPSEAKVALLLARGFSNKMVAEHLSIRAATARRHTERVFAKLGVNARAQVAPRIGT